MRFDLCSIKRGWLAVGVVVIAAGVVILLSRLRPEEERAYQPLPNHLTLVETLSGESTLASIENLPNFDDVCWVAGLSTGNTMTIPESYRYTSSVIPKLNRVRKILQESRSAREVVIPKLKEMLARSMEDFEEALQQHKEKSNKGGYVMGSPDKYMRARTSAQATTYLLEEFDAFDALPLLSRVYHTKGNIPVHRLFLGYAIHLLATRHPRDGLSPEARAALDEYLKVAKDIPAPETVEVPAWNATMTETDFRVMILQQDIGLDKQPQVRQNLYPHSLSGYEDVYGTIVVTFDPLVEKMDRFIKAAYP